MLTTSSHETREFSSTSLLGMQPLWPELKTMPERGYSIEEEGVRFGLIKTM